MLREYGSQSNKANQTAEITLKGTMTEINDVRRMMAGEVYLYSEHSEYDNRLSFQSHPRFQPLPDPVTDPIIAPHWSMQYDRPHKVQEFPSTLKADGHFSASYNVSHLCGYHWSPDQYEKAAKKLESFGFECLRSKRGRDGKYWEVWHLPGLFMAKGALKEFESEVRGKEWDIEARLVARFIADRVSFGSLDVSVQRMAMVIDD